MWNIFQLRVSNSLENLKKKLSVVLSRVFVLTGNEPQNITNITTTSISFSKKLAVV